MMYPRAHTCTYGCLENCSRHDSVGSIYMYDLQPFVTPWGLYSQLLVILYQEVQRFWRLSSVTLCVVSLGCESIRCPCCLDCEAPQAYFILARGAILPVTFYCCTRQSTTTTGSLYSFQVHLRK